MKPIVVVVNDKLTKEDVEQIINEAYTAGYTDGYDAGKNQNSLNWPQYPYYPYTPIIYSDNPAYKPNEWTCEDIHSLSDFPNTISNIVDKYIAELKL